MMMPVVWQDGPRQSELLSASGLPPPLEPHCFESKKAKLSKSSDTSPRPKLCLACQRTFFAEYFDRHACKSSLYRTCPQCKVSMVPQNMTRHNCRELCTGTNTTPKALLAAKNTAKQGKMPGARPSATSHHLMGDLVPVGREDSSTACAGAPPGAGISDAEAEALKAELGLSSDRIMPNDVRAALDWLTMDEHGSHRDVCAR
jgi:hypothetical protein